MQRRSFLGAISAGLFGVRLPASEPVKQVLVSTSFKVKKCTISPAELSDEMMLACDGSAERFIREQMIEDMAMRIDREMMG